MLFLLCCLFFRFVLTNLLFISSNLSIKWKYWYFLQQIKLLKATWLKHKHRICGKCFIGHTLSNSLLYSMSCYKDGKWTSNSRPLLKEVCWRFFILYLMERVSHTWLLFRTNNRPVLRSFRIREWREDFVAKSKY